MSAPWQDFDVFHNKDILTGTLVADSQLYIGCGRSDNEFGVDNALIRVVLDSEERPYIPGSSLKGLFRNEVERFLRMVNETPCDVFDHRSPCQDRNSNELCPACQIFGSQKVASHVAFRDAYPTKNTISKEKKGIAINRITGGVHGGALYEFEVLQPGAAFAFRLDSENLKLAGKDVRAVALQFVLKQLVAGNLQIGGGKSKGLGYIHLENMQLNSMRLEGQRLTTKDMTKKLKKILLGGTEDE